MRFKLTAHSSPLDFHSGFLPKSYRAIGTKSTLLLYIYLVILTIDLIYHNNS